MPLGAKPGAPLAVNRLPGVNANQLVIPIEGDAQTPVQLVLKVAEVNLQIVMAEYSGGTDLHVSEGAEKLLEHKILRSGVAKREGFARMLELKRIPDIRAAVEAGALSLPNIWKVRQHRSSKLFRRWLAKEEVDTANDLVRLYIESMEETSLSESLPARILRFALTTDIGLVSTVAGVAAGIVDSFFVNHFLKGYRPKLMFDSLGKLFPEGLTIEKQVVKPTVDLALASRNGCCASIHLFFLEQKQHAVATPRLLDVFSYCSVVLRFSTHELTNSAWTNPQDACQLRLFDPFQFLWRDAA